MVNKKRLFMVMCLVLMVMAPMFASNMSETAGGYTLDLSWLKTGVNLFVGLLGGGTLLFKTGLDIYHAVNNLSEDPNGIKKVVGRFLVCAIALGGFLFAVNFVLAGAGGTTSGSGDAVTVTADPKQNSAFYNALTGALVTLGL